MFWDSSVNRPREMSLPQLLPPPTKGAAGVLGTAGEGTEAISTLGSEEEGMRRMLAVW